MTPGRRSFDDDWRFLRADAAGAEAPAFDDRAWRRLRLPHDWSVEPLPPRPVEETGEGSLWTSGAQQPSRLGPFDTEQSAGGRDTGWFVGGTGWYRKHFSFGKVPAEGRVEIRFDGVYMNASVWLNGHLLGDHPYGYTTFTFDLTPHLRDGDNVIAVRVRNEGRNSRWYSGSGIYRHVWLTVSAGLRVPDFGLYITTPDATTARAAITVENLGAAREVTVRSRVLDAGGKVVAQSESTQSIDGAAQVSQEVKIAGAKLWSPAAPNLYRWEVALVAGGKTVDRAAASTFGIRTIEVDAERGLRINGESVKLRGGCMHHDNGLLGACTIDRAEERRIELMKSAGFNAIRTSHNPPSPAFLDACDRLGMLVLDEAFDHWEKEKNPQDYHLYFDDWWQRDVDAMVLRDRNHPSVILWSIGNEIPERNDPRGVEIAKQLVARIKANDTTRPVTAAINGTFQASESLDKAFQHLDVGGYNYLWGFYEADHQRHPQRIILGTESFPQHAFKSWKPVEDHPYVIGDFVWTGMDHLGESSIGNAQLAELPGAGGFPEPKMPEGLKNIFTGLDRFGNISLTYPWFNCYCGDIDLIGELKPQGYYRRVLWKLSRLEMAVQRPVPARKQEVISAWGWSDELRSWTWPGFEGKPLKVRVYSTAASVRLVLNGRILAEKTVSAATELTAEFEVPYERGELKAIAMEGDKPVAELAFRTVGAPAALKLRVDHPQIGAGPGNLAFVTLDVVDAAGNLVPDASIPVAFRAEGAGRLVASGTANPKDPASFRNPRLRTYHGRALAILGPSGTPGTITLFAESPGLAAASATVSTR